VQLHPVADTTLIEAAPDHNMGGMIFFNAGTAGNGSRNRGLLQFDFSGVIPVDAIVQSAALELTVVQTPTEGQGQPSLFGVHRVLLPWGEGVQVAENPFSPGLGASAAPGEATWNHRFFGGNETWSSAGGEAGVDFMATLSSVELIEDIDIYLLDTTPRMVSDVQSWVSDPESNFGWMLQSLSEDVRFTARRFASIEDAFSAPMLTVTFEVVPEPAGWLLMLPAWLAWAMRKPMAALRRRGQSG
jgi:hypothetical protein